MKEQLKDAAFVLVDIQNDFCPGGALAVNEGDQIVDVVNSLMPEFPLVISTQDWHPANHISFKERGGPWPPHCVQGTRGAELHPALDQSPIAYYFRKAYTPDRDAYSEFEGRDDQGRTLDEVLKSHKVKKVFVAGLATDYCVKATVLDALKLGYDTYAITDAMRAVNVEPGDDQKALEEMKRNGAHLITSGEILSSDEHSSATVR
ncbi:MAG TPA: bifunctional nicotinamidase/pyrazinamidase [Blastocatellia bacterium]|nr:bifunctional nicotinamidase/pyrazinamidase [Blastocatellia bacterium]